MANWNKSIITLIDILHDQAKLTVLSTPAVLMDSCQKSPSSKLQTSKGWASSIEQSNNFFKGVRSSSTTQKIQILKKNQPYKNCIKNEVEILIFNGRCIKKNWKIEHQNTQIEILIIFTAFFFAFFAKITFYSGETCDVLMYIVVNWSASPLASSAAFKNNNIPANSFMPTWAQSSLMKMIARPSSSHSEYEKKSPQMPASFKSTILNRFQISTDSNSGSELFCHLLSKHACIIFV